MKRSVHLEVIDVRNPCTERWELMEGEGAIRRCGVCRLDVYDLSAMTREDAEQLVATTGKLCVRFHRRADGTVTTLDCGPRRLEALRRRARVGLAIGAGFVAAALGIMGALGFAMASDGANFARVWGERVVEPPEPMMMGEMEPMPPPAPPPEIAPLPPVDPAPQGS